MTQSEQSFSIGIDYPAQLNASFWSDVMKALTAIGAEVDVDEVDNIATITGPRSAFFYALLIVAGLECVEVGGENSPVLGALSLAVTMYRTALETQKQEA